MKKGREMAFYYEVKGFLPSRAQGHKVLQGEPRSEARNLEKRNLSGTPRDLEEMGFEPGGTKLRLSSNETQNSGG